MIERNRDDSEYLQRLQRLRDELQVFLDKCPGRLTGEQIQQHTELCKAINSVLAEWRQAVEFRSG